MFKTLTRALAALALAVGLLGTAGPAVADVVNQTFLGGVAIKGYDPVAYFEEGAAVEGSSSHSFEWEDATWHFASAANRDKFAADPARYAPQHGGYCAYAVSKGTTADIDPEAFAVVDGKLYLNFNKAIQDQWNADRAGHIATADENWPGIKAGL